MPATVMVEESIRPSRRKHVLAAFGFKDFWLFWVGILLSMTGKWIQITAVAYLMLHSAPNSSTAALWIGYLALSQAVPALLALPVAGVLCDMMPRKVVVWNTNAGSALCSVVLCLMVQHKITALLPLLGISALSSAVRALDVPARQAWVPRLVPREYVSQAVGLNTVALHSANVMGPVLAGLLLIRFPVSNLFMLNVFLTVMMMVAIIFIASPPRKTREKTPIVRALFDGMASLLDQTQLRLTIIGILSSALLVRGYLLMLLAFIQTEMLAGPGGIAFLYAANGLGLVLGALTTAYMGNIPGRDRVWSISGIVLAMCIVLLAIAHDALDALPWVFFAGYASMLYVGSTNLKIQAHVPLESRARATSAHAVLMTAFIPLGVMVLGIESQFVGMRAAFILCSSVFVVVQIVLWIIQDRMEHFAKLET
jgi:MFS family permease